MSEEKNNFPVLVVVVAILAISVGVFTQISGEPESLTSQDSLPELSKAIILPKPKALIDKEFINHRGERFGLEQLTGKWSILFFGFSYCPDICPTTMQTLSTVKKAVSDAGAWNNYQVVMVSVDPERDTVERLASYVPYFDPEFTGVVGTIADTTEFAKQLGILFVRRDEQGDALYQVDHSVSLILINPQGEWAGVITAPHKADEISSDLIKLAKHFGEAPGAAVETAQATPTQSTAALAKPMLPETALSENPSQQDRGSALTISSAWIRPAPPNAPSLAGYFDLANNSDQDIVITEVSSNAFANTMIHSTEMQDGMAVMSHLSQLNVPANSRVALQPMGTHLMLMQAQKAVNIGDIITVEITTENGEKFSFPVTVKNDPR